MTNNKIALFLDIDGTLYDKTIRDLRPSTIEIIDKLSKDDRFDLFIATGRSKNTITHIKKYFDKFKGFVFANGQIVEIDGNCIYNNTINYEHVNNFIDYCDKMHYTMVLLTNTLLYYNEFEEVAKTNFEKNIAQKIYPLNGKRFNQTDIINQIWLFVDNATLEELRPKFSEFNIINWGTKFGSDIIPSGSSKGEGVVKVIEYMGYDIKNTYAIGDSDNDVVMFKKVGTSICMGNGTETAKRYADIVGYDILEEGLAKNIIEYILKEKPQI